MNNKICTKNADFFCLVQIFFVILQRKMNRALVAKKVLRYLAHAEGICLSGGGKYGHKRASIIRFLMLRNSVILEWRRARMDLF